LIERFKMTRCVGVHLCPFLNRSGDEIQLRDQRLLRGVHGRHAAVHQIHCRSDLGERGLSGSRHLSHRVEDEESLGGRLGLLRRRRRDSTPAEPTDHGKSIWWRNEEIHPQTNPISGFDSSDAAIWEHKT
jgi:hypothetical protein